MRINNNLMAMNTHRQLGIANNNGSKSMEKLSSGQRINRAGDDAAGLSISEKMRGQIRGLNQASSNAQDGISLIQTAEGALDESHAILQRMRELAVQSSNDTNVSEDRDALQAEVDQLATELTRIAENTEFNTQNLLDGNFEDKVFHIGANKGQSMELSISAMDADALKVQGTVYEAQGIGSTGLELQSLDGETINVEFAASAATGNAEVTETKAEFTGATITVTLAQDAAATSGAAAGSITATMADVKTALESVASDAGVKVIEGDTFSGTTAAATTTASISSWTEDEEASAQSGINISSQTAADGAITTINTALQSVSEQRSQLGAVQNRLEHTISNLDTSSENLQAAESRIRDVDMAQEMMEFTKNNILQQASQSMLAQANQAPQSVLQLLG